MPAYLDDNGTWYALFYYENFKKEKKRKKKRGFGTEQETNDYEDDFKAKASLAKYLPFKDFAGIYMENVGPRVRISTYDTKVQSLSKRLVPFFEKKPLNEITSLTVPSQPVAKERCTEMGYRSEVRIATTREGYDLMCEKVDSLSDGLDRCPLMGTEQEPEFFDENDGCVVFGWDNVRWYEGMLVDVTNIVKALAELAAQEIPHEFCRIGETWDDIEFATSGENEDLSLHVEPVVYIDVF